ncbi:MAG: hypothetical protein JWO82_1224, partial [Akkermansiaceae bacterium]|nr:hypothetical protein [Akkermansiaceae bacterium]
METTSTPAPDKALLYLTRATAALVGCIALAAFSLSFEALRDLAVRSGALPARTAFLLPCLVDGAVVVFELACLRAALTGAMADEKRIKLLVIGVTLASILFNVLHASPGLLPACIAAVPPCLLFACFEILLMDLRRRHVKAPKAKRATTKQSVSATSPAAETTAKRREEALELAGQGISRNAIARRLGVSAGSVRRYLTS